MDNNTNTPELEKLTEAVNIYDYLLQEGVFITEPEKERALMLIDRLENIVDELEVLKEE